MFVAISATAQAISPRLRARRIGIVKLKQFQSNRSVWRLFWIPACAGMTLLRKVDDFQSRYVWIELALELVLRHNDEARNRLAPQ